MSSFRIRLSAMLLALAASVSVAAAVAAIPVEHGAVGARQPGWFLVFGFAGGRVQPPAVMTTAQYVPGRAALQDRHWRLRLLDANGAELIATALDSPLAMPDAARQPENELLMSARLPQLPSATRFELLDGTGIVVWQQAIDDTFRNAADSSAANAAALARTARAPQAVAAEHPVRKLMELQQRRHDSESAAALAALNDDTKTPQQRAEAVQRLHELQTPIGATSPTLGDAVAPLAVTPPALLPPLPAGAVSAQPAASAPTYLINGNVTTNTGVALKKPTLRAFRHDSGAYVTSGIPDPSTGHYELRVPAGSYDVELNLGAREFIESDKVLYLAPQRIANIAVGADTQQDFLVTLPTRALTISIRRNNLPYWTGSIAVEIAQGGTLIARQAFNYLPDSNKSNGDATATATNTVQITPGVYDITIEATGNGVARKTFSGVDLGSADQTLNFDTSTTSAWSGKLLDSGGKPIAGRSLTSFDGLFHRRGFAQTDAGGNFSIAVAPGWFIMFPAVSGSDDVPLRLDITSTDNLPATVQLSAIPLQTVVNGNSTRIYTGGDANRLRVMFIGDAYTTAHETFTDKNGNGVWDGVLCYDLNGNGVYDTGDICAVYGNATMPASGTPLPVASNEPFVDLNGDGFPNFDDGATFLLNAQAFTRSLLSAHYFSDHRGAFQMDAAFIPSNQAGITIKKSDGTTPYTSDTAFGASMDTTRSILSLNRTKALQVAEQIQPGFDVLVIMINEPIPAGRANETIGAVPGIQVEKGGVLGVNINSPVIPHEMGHFVGSLLDEYGEFYTAPQGTNTAANITGNLISIPWLNSLPGAQSLPDLIPHVGTGVFEGAATYNGGYYRPTWTSMMRNQYDGEPFNAPSIAALDRGLKRFNQPYVTLNQHGLSGSWYNPQSSGQGLLVDVQKDLLGPGQGFFFAGWFTFDTTAGGTDRQRWYTLGGTVNDNDASARVDIYATYGGNFATTPKVVANKVGSATISFTDCGHGTLSYRFDDGRSGSIALTRILNNLICTQTTDAGGLYLYDYSAGTWYDPATSGQGLLFDVSSNYFGDYHTTPGAFAAAWYTFAANGQSSGGGASQRWYTLQGPTPLFPAGALFTLDIIETTSGVFDNAAPVSRRKVGGATIITTCASATLSYNFTAGENAGKSGSIALSRLGQTPLGSCR